MCLTPRVAAPAPVAPAPTRAAVTAEGNKPVSPTAQAATRDKVRRRLGVFGNLSSTPMGDASYGNSIAAFG